MKIETKTDSFLGLFVRHSYDLVRTSGDSSLDKRIPKLLLALHETARLRVRTHSVVTRDEVYQWFLSCGPRPRP